jgi:hypothetical protein
MHALKNRSTGELFSCSLVNIYDFPYHGVKVWQDADEARAEYASFLALQGVNEPWVWELHELEENQVRLCNVKLNNNPAKRLFLTAEGRIEARTIE